MSAALDRTSSQFAQTAEGGTANNLLTYITTINKSSAELRHIRRPDPTYTTQPSSEMGGACPN